MTIASAAASTAVAAVASTSATTSASVNSFALSSVLNLARGGAITAATTATAALLHDFSSPLSSSTQTATSIQESLRGGAKKPEPTTTTKVSLTDKGTSVLCMAIAMSLHYLSYSIARPSTIALFTSAKTGFAGNTAAFPLAMAFISPTSLCLLLLYGKILNRAGPRGAVKETTFLCASVLWGSAVLVYLLQGMESGVTPISIFGAFSIKPIQILVGALFIFRESYVQLLTSQYWSFMASVLTPDQSAKWFSPISGLTSVTSAISGFGVRSVVEKIGLPGALGLAGAILITSLLFTERAYSISDAVSDL